MEKIYEELDEAKAEIEKLKAECRSKAEQSESLKRAYNEQLSKYQEARQKLEKQTQELNERVDEVSEAKQICEDLKCSLREKESIVIHLGAANDRLRSACNEKSQTWDEEKRGLIIALDEANKKIADQQEKISVLNREIQGLKQVLSASQKKCSEIEKKEKASREMKERSDVLFNLEEEKSKVEDQLKWKKEQFKHLEEAHEKLREQFKVGKKEWEMEKSMLLDEICSLQMRLDSQTRISEDLEKRLQMCNQALAHEESQRKYLEIQVSEFQEQYENVVAECHDAKSKIELLTSKRDAEIASLRNSMGQKDAHHKELKYETEKLELENQELLKMVKELQEACIHKSGATLPNLRKKLKSLEQSHKNCTVTLKAKEAEWGSQLEEMTAELHKYKFALEGKDTELKQLKVELEVCYLSLMKLMAQNEEDSVMLILLKSAIAEMQMYLSSKDREEKASVLMKQVEMKNSALIEVETDLKEEREKVLSLLKKVECFHLIEQKTSKMQEELGSHKELLKAGAENTSQLTKQLEMKNTALLKAERDLEEQYAKTSSLLNKVETFDLLEGQRSKMQEELERHKELLKDREENISHLMKQLEMKNTALLKAEGDLEQKTSKMQEELGSHKELLKAASENTSQLMKQLEMKNTALLKAERDLEEQYAKTSSLLNKVETFDLLEGQSSKMQEELERHKELLKDREENISHLMKQLEMKNTALLKAEGDLEEQYEKTSSLLKKVESFNLVEGQRLKTQEELDRYKELLEESSEFHCQLEDKMQQKEQESKEKLRKLRSALDRANSELAEKVCEANEIQFELWIWKSIAEWLKTDLEESRETRKELEASLLVQVEACETIKQEKNILLHKMEEKDQQIHNLHQELKAEEDKANSTKMNAAMASESVQLKHLQILKRKDEIVEDLQKEIEYLELESLRREFEGAMLAQTAAEGTLELEKKNLAGVVEEKEKRIADLLQQLGSLEAKLNDSLISFSSQVNEKEAEIDLVRAALEKITAAEFLAKVEVEEKQLMIIKLEKQICELQQKLEVQEKSSLETEAELEAKRSAMIQSEELASQLEFKLKSSDALIEKLKSENINLKEDITNLSTEKENLVSFIREIDDKIGKFSDEDMKLMGVLGRIMQSFGSGSSGVDLKHSHELLEQAKENAKTSSMAMKKSDDFSEGRSPFRELNYSGY